MNHKLEKFLIGLCAGTAVSLAVLGLKIQKETGEAERLRSDLRESLVSAEKVRTMIDLQNQIVEARRKKLEVADSATPGAKEQTTFQTVVIPGKVVPRTDAKNTRTS